MSEVPTVYRMAPQVGWVDGSTYSPGEAVRYVASLPDGPILVLRDSAAAIWAAASEGGTLEMIVDRVAAGVGVDRAEIAGDVESFLADMVRRGLLCTSADGAGRDLALA